MHRKTRLFFLIPLFLTAMAGQTGNLDIPKNMKPYFLGLLIEEKGAPEQSQQEQQRMAQQHLACIRTQVEAGKYLVVGPLADNNRIRGIAIVSAASLEEARTILNGDPAVKSGRMTVEVHPAMFPDLSGIRITY